MARFNGSSYLRKQVEKHTAPASFPNDVPYDTQAGAPMSAQGAGAGQRYEDPAKAALPPASSGVRAGTAAAQKPFKNVKGGK